MIEIPCRSRKGNPVRPEDCAAYLQQMFLPGAGLLAICPFPTPEADALMNRIAEAVTMRAQCATCSPRTPSSSILAARTGPYGQACAQFRDLMNRSDRSIVYEPPEIEDVLVDGKLAVVRLTWNGTIKGVDGSVLEQTKERGLGVFRRQDDGHWRITTSYAFPLD